MLIYSPVVLKTIFLKLDHTLTPMAKMHDDGRYRELIYSGDARSIFSYAGFQKYFKDTFPSAEIMQDEVTHPEHSKYTKIFQAKIPSRMRADRTIDFLLREVEDGDMSQVVLIVVGTLDDVFSVKDLFREYSCAGIASYLARSKQSIILNEKMFGAKKSRKPKNTF